MAQLARVQKRYDDGTVLVRQIRQSACNGDCPKCGGCASAGEALLRAENPIGAKLGELVILRADEKPVLRAAALLCGLPVALFFLGYALGMALWQQGAAAGSCGFLAGAALAAIHDRRTGKKQNTGYVIAGYPEDLPKSWEKGDNDLD